MSLVGLLLLLLVVDSNFVNSGRSKRRRRLVNLSSFQEILSSTLHGGDPLQQPIALVVLAELIHYSLQTSKLAELGGIFKHFDIPTILFRLVQDCWRPTAQLEALGCIQLIVVYKPDEELSYKGLLIDSRLLPVLVQVLHDAHSASVRMETLDLIKTAASVSEFRRQFFDNLETVDELCRLLTQPGSSQSDQLAFVDILTKLTNGSHHQIWSDFLVERMPFIVHLLYSSQVAIYTDAYELICKFADSPNLVHELVDALALTRITELWLSSEESRCMPAAPLLLKLATHDQAPADHPSLLLHALILSWNQHHAQSRASMLVSFFSDFPHAVLVRFIFFLKS